ncbi:MAG: cobalt ABC transporter ATP-binding protein [Chloroflexi bacterium HGW-Chloroflexi-10]|nr:MAG: cobalt ABC transporter ATP-binding protein [Chloroflexi bacterium HGW-Chloroflexi-10]
MNMAIDIDQLRFQYPDGHHALMGIDIKIRQGEKVALVGANGAGKSTLILHLNGILLGQGSLKIKGLSLNKQSLNLIRGKVGLVFQNPDDQLFSPTVYEDVAYGPIYQGLPQVLVDKRVKEALAQVGMGEFIQRNSTHLSVGEKKRIAIATVLSMIPDILVLDEPTAGLDPRARRNLISLLHSLPQTMLVATHDLDMVKQLLPRTVLMSSGTVVADGFTEEVLGNQALLLEHGL